MSPSSLAAILEGYSVGSGIMAVIFCLLGKYEIGTAACVLAILSHLYAQALWRSG